MNFFPQITITFLSLVLLARVAPTGACKSQVTIQSPRVTNWGSWGAMENCNDGKYAVGFQLKTQRATSGDNTGLNGIRILCGNPNTNDIDSAPSSLVGQWGDWGRAVVCGKGSLLTGFQLRSESAADGGTDNTAANNLRGRCTFVTSSEKPGTIQGDGTSWGDWTSWQYCPEDHAVCGIQTQVQSPRGNNNDDTALNEVDMTCCQLPAIATCVRKATSKCEQYRNQCSECLSVCMAAANSFCSRQFQLQ